MSSNILDASALISLLPNVLPADSKTLSSPQDGLTALVHSVFVTLAFRLTAVDDSTSEIIDSKVLPSRWNNNSPGHYALKYRHDQSSLEFLLNVSKLGSRTLFNAIALETEKVATLDVSTDDFTSPSFYPHDAQSSDKPLVHGFISSNRVTDFVSQLKLKVIQKLIPGLQKEGYSEETEPSGSSTSTQPPTSNDPQPARPQAGPPPDAPHLNPYGDRVYPPRNPLEIGRSDLDPFPTNPFAPPSLFPRGGGDGMFVGPNHPIFGDRGGNDPRRGPWGGDGFLPPLGAPPGARFDPVGPAFPSRGPRGSFPQGPPASGNLRDPDNDEFLPPNLNNYGNMFM